MSCSLMHQEFAPLTAQADRRIIQFDRESGFGPGGTLPNRNRFYTYLTRNGSDVEIRTVAVKAINKTARPMVKEVVRASVDDPWIHVRDLGFMPIGGYMVDWAPEGFSKLQHWAYGRGWDVAAYAPRCMWKIDAPVVNPELLKKTRRFRWAAWDPACDNILDYLKVYREHPEIELLSKSGLGRYCTKVTIVRKLKTDKAFLQFFMLNADTIKRDSLGADVIMKAYNNGVSFGDAVRRIDARRGFRYCNLPRNICALKASGYINKRSISRGDYADYLSNCRTMGMDLADTKVSFPKNFKERSRIAQDMVDAIRRLQKAEEIEKMNRQLESVAKKWSRLERSGRDYRIVLPRTEQDFIDAGKAMSNCLGQYAARVARGELVVVFVRQASHPRKAFVAAAYDPKSETVKQCYGKNNSKPPKPVSDFVQRVFTGAASKKQLKEAA